jgi:hypothetical protein
MIPLETQIFRLIFPPSGSIPLEKIEAVPIIRQHIDSIIDLASTEHGISSPGESAALTARIIELRDTPGPDGKIRTWRTIAEICGTTLDAVRHRYGKGKATIRKSRIVEEATSEGAVGTPTTVFYNINEEHGLGHMEPRFIIEAEPVNLGEPTEQEQKPDEVPFPLIFGSTWEEVDRMLGEGMAVKEISAELEKNGRPVPWTKIRARTAYLARMKSKEAKPELEKADEPEPAAAQPEEEPQEAEATDDRPEPVSISRKELDLRIWDMWKAGETLDGISDILYSEGLYYSAKSVRVRLLSQGAKL